MSGTVTITERKHTPVKLVKFAWTSNTGGAATTSTANIYDGSVLGLATVPDGVAAPTDNYDVAINDDNGLDVLAGAGVNRDTANTEYITNQDNLNCVSGSKLNLSVSNAGSEKSGETYIWIR